jgi:hypothetical protein
VNQISRTIPPALGLLTALTTLALGGNDFTGNVPSELGSLNALTRLGLGGNSFTGTLLSELGSLTKLMLLYLDSNAFKGTFPSEFGSLTALTTLAFEKNAITGTLSSELGSLTAPGVTVDEFCEQALQGASKLHGLGRGQAYCLPVDAREGIVHNEAGAAFTLWDNPERQDAEVGEMVDSLVREHGPITLGGVVRHLVADKWDMF